MPVIGIIEAPMVMGIAIIRSLLTIVFIVGPRFTLCSTRS